MPIFVLIALLCVLAAGPANAHAQLVHVEPAADTTVPTAPVAVVLTFDEPVTPLVFRWIGPDGRTEDAVARGQNTRVIVSVPPGTARGSQLLSWRVSSADGHPVGGSLGFAIGAPSASGMTSPPVAPTAAVAAAAAGLLTLLLAIGVGGVVFTALVDPAGGAPAWTRRLARTAAGAALPATVLALAAQGCDLLGSFEPFSANLWQAALSSPFARTAALAAVAGLLAAFGRGRTAALVAWTLAALAFAASGHVATASPRWLAIPAIAVHGAALVFWLGALPPVAGWAASGRAGLAPALARFSRLAVPVVALLVLSGATLAAIQLGRPAALVDTAYGRLLSVKLAGVAAMLALAAVNRTRLTPGLAAGGEPRALARSTGAELLLGLAVIGLASGFRLTPPPRILAAAEAAREVDIHLTGADLIAMLTLRPGMPGPNTVEMSLTGPQHPAEVRLAFSLPEHGIEPIRLTATEDGAVWRFGPVVLPVAATWTATLSVRIGDFDQRTLTGMLPLGP